MERRWWWLLLGAILMKIMCDSGNVGGTNVVRDYITSTDPKPALVECPEWFEGRMYDGTEVDRNWELVEYDRRADDATSELARKAIASAILKSLNKIHDCFRHPEDGREYVMWYDKGMRWGGEMREADDIYVSATPKLTRPRPGSWGWERGFECKSIALMIYTDLVQKKVKGYESTLIRDVHIWLFEIAWKYVNLEVKFQRQQHPSIHNAHTNHYYSSSSTSTTIHTQNPTHPHFNASNLKTP